VGVAVLLPHKNKFEKTIPRNLRQRGSTPRVRQGSVRAGALRKSAILSGTPGLRLVQEQFPAAPASFPAATEWFPAVSRLRR
jgi:hypothetical protein